MTRGDLIDAELYRLQELIDEHRRKRGTYRPRTPARMTTQAEGERARFGAVR